MGVLLILIGTLVASGLGYSLTWQFLVWWNKPKQKRCKDCKLFIGFSEQERHDVCLGRGYASGADICCRYTRKLWKFWRAK